MSGQTLRYEFNLNLNYSSTVDYMYLSCRHFLYILKCFSTDHLGLYRSLLYIDKQVHNYYKANAINIMYEMKDSDANGKILPTNVFSDPKQLSQEHNFKTKAGKNTKPQIIIAQGSIHVQNSVQFALTSSQIFQFTTLHVRKVNLHKYSQNWDSSTACIMRKWIYVAGMSLQV